MGSATSSGLIPGIRNAANALDNVGSYHKLVSTHETRVPGGAVFTLYDTFGFPDDLTEIIAGERGFGVDHEGFAAEMDKARAMQLWADRVLQSAPAKVVPLRA